MGQETAIEWCHHSFNPWWGCTRVSPGCENCYAETFAKRVGQRVWGPQAERRRFSEKHWQEPFKWNRLAGEAGERRRVFCASMADVFEDRRDLDVERELLWALIERTPWLDWLLLTKRPENHRLAPAGWPRMPNVWLGCTAENQEYADRRIPELIAAPWPAVRFVSYEPALGPVRFDPRDLGPVGHLAETFGNRLVNWVIVGGESGGRAREFDIDWARSAVAQCRAAGVPVFVKQLGARPFERRRCDAPACNCGGTHDNRVVLDDGKGGDWDEWQAHLAGLHVREFPVVHQPGGVQYRPARGP